MTIQPWLVRGAEDFDKVFVAMHKQRPDGFQVLGGPVMRDNRKRIIGFALKNRLPSVYDNRVAVEAGGLISYGADLTYAYKRVATYVDKILKGTKPADLPVEQPKKFEFIINLKTAKQIGLIIPPNVLVRADRVIK
jgi:putative ABC transport system substrate-binding protein